MIQTLSLNIDEHRLLVRVLARTLHMPKGFLSPAEVRVIEKAIQQIGPVT